MLGIFKRANIAQAMDKALIDDAEEDPLVDEMSQDDSAKSP